MWGRLILSLICLAVYTRGLFVQNIKEPQNPCPPGGSCLVDDAVCVSGDCVCNGNFTKQPMDGRLDCYKDTERFARIVNDPQVKVFDGATYKFVLPCRVLFSHIRSDLRTEEEGNVGRCLCQVYFWNRKRHGKIYVDGLDFTCIIRRTAAPHFRKKFTTRIYAFGTGIGYFFIEQGSMRFADNSPGNVSISINQSGIVYQSQYDLDNNRVILDFWNCGHRVTFSPYNLKKPATNQPFLPGLSVAIDTAVTPKFQRQGRVMATGPVDLGGRSIESARISGLDLQTSFMFRALTHAPPQSESDANVQCLRGKSVIKKCSRRERRRVQRRCNFLFENAKLMRCLDNTSDGETILSLYLNCVESICDPSVACSHFVNSLLTFAANCHPVVTAAVRQYRRHVRGSWKC